MGSMVDHPDHYQRYGIECLDLVRWMIFDLGNIVKYVFRANGKGHAGEDLLKAHRYAVDWCQHADSLPDPFTTRDGGILFDLMCRLQTMGETTSGVEQRFWLDLERMADGSCEEWPYILHDDTAMLLLANGIMHENCPLYDKEIDHETK